MDRFNESFGQITPAILMHEYSNLLPVYSGWTTGLFARYFNDSLYQGLTSPAVKDYIDPSSMNLPNRLFVSSTWLPWLSFFHRTEMMEHGYITESSSCPRYLDPRLLNDSFTSRWPKSANLEHPCASQWLICRLRRCDYRITDESSLHRCTSLGAQWIGYRCRV